MINNMNIDYKIKYSLLVFLLCMSILMGWVIYKLPRYECVKSHEEIRYQDARYTPVWIGKMFIQQYHPAYYYRVTICDKEIISNP